MNLQVKNDKYIFDPANRTITFVGLSSMFLSSIYAIFNVTDGICIYDFGDPSKIGTLNNNILTLAYNTTSMAASDSLLIKYDDGNLMGVDIAMKVQDESIPLLRRMVRLLEAVNNVDNGNRQRVTVDSMTSGMTLTNVTNMGTLTTLTGITNAVPVGNIATVASYDQRQFADTSRVNYNTGIRSNLIFT